MELGLRHMIEKRKMPLSRENAIVLLWYACTYLFYYHWLGPGFKSFGLLDFSHFLNPEWLKNDLLESLIYLHGQPPLMNVLIGVIFKIAPDYYEPIFRSLYFIAGGMAVLCINKTMAIFSVSGRIRAITLFFACAMPTLYMYGTWYYCTHLEFCISACALYFLAHYLKHGREVLASLVMLFVCFALLGLLRPQWHLALFILLTLGMLYLRRFQDWRKVAVLSLIFIVPLTGWYAKNALVFGFFGPSSWLGANVGQVAVQAGLNADPATRASLDAKMDAGIISDSFPQDFDIEIIMHFYPPTMFGDAMSKMALQPYKSTDPDFLAYAGKHPQDIYLPYNFNYIGMMLAARQDMRDAITILKEVPTQYVVTTLHKMLEISGIPSFWHVSLNLVPFRPSLNGVWVADIGIIRESAVISSRMLYLFIPLFMLCLAFRDNETARRDFAFLAFALMLFMWVTACAFNGWEQERMRWGWCPVYIVYAAFFLEALKRCPGYVKQWWKRTVWPIFTT